MSYIEIIAKNDEVTVLDEVYETLYVSGLEWLDDLLVVKIWCDSPCGSAEIEIPYPEFMAMAAKANACLEEMKLLASMPQTTQPIVK